MISSLLMASLSFKKGSILVYNDIGLSLSDITKKLNYYHSLIVFHKNFKKSGNYHKKTLWS